MIDIPFRKPARLAGLVAFGLLALAGCAHGPAAPRPAASRTPAAFDHDGEVAGIVALLDRGDTAAAGPRIDALLARDPADPQARVLRDSLVEDPKVLLGPKSFAYTVKPGETMLGLAERFLGNRLKSYQLARYNGIAVPASLAAGTELRIPGVAPKAAPRPIGPRRPAPRGRGAAAGAAAGGTPAVAAPTRTDPAASRTARAAGLAALAQGNLDRAVVQLRRAVALDPANPLARRDLDRAERIGRTVKARR